MSASELSRALSSLGPIPGVADAVARLLGASEFAALPENLVVGFHVRVDGPLIAVYAVGPRVFALHEQTADGRVFSLSVPLSRVRRVAVLEDATAMRLTVELDSDRNTLTPVDGAPGSLVNIPAGYELLESETARRDSLRSLQVALTRALAYAS